jgi:hypothetical protein
MARISFPDGGVIGINLKIFLTLLNQRGVKLCKFINR